MCHKGGGKLKPVAFVYRDQEQIMQVYINEFEEEELDRLEEEGMLFFAEYPGGHFRRPLYPGSCPSEYLHNGLS